MVNNEAALRAVEVTMAYERRVIGRDLSVDIPDGEFTVIIGPNACGKSTLLRTLSRLLTPIEGAVHLDGRDIASLRTKDVATWLGLLPQSALTPPGITVFDLVSRGRYPHQSVLSRWSTDDERSVRHALASTGMTELADRAVDELSGGQRQRAWVAMALALALAQQNSILLLDEPTTFLDISHQLALMELFAELNRSGGRTVVAVLHDINHAARYAGHLIVMSEGRIVAQGPPADVLTAPLLAEVFGIEAVIIPDPLNGGPLVVTGYPGRDRATTTHERTATA
ncbi:ABC-type Fe3+-siderophore transport system, ATPase component [Pseudonocardia sp. Ae263_Ps1]|uniref:ABC transporter ATP-binding protein n=2 Tax=Pseudonocardia TaxID=1847 RepID=UPI000964C89D|nr:ABC-type Fe3+-siderophore transport system, ATPase component [Pseudonocardia sp. Ae150A_Ps1]OLL86393.1 ABC-type Fe3+-siderophore transport system, ATPase component [Pseudonocardia sp. Ae263_Ps1]OLL93566.1 ABC-type Fe3+-siderophore transport system, ATPase component [Pseudonocardia sp. Ae356_Ps1]